LLIGKAVVAWARLEHSINEVIWAFLRVPVEDGRIITSSLDTRYRLNLLRALGERHLAKDHLAILSDILKKINDLVEFRNLIIHGLWVTILPENVPAVQSLRGKLPNEANSNEVVTTVMPPDLMRNITDRATFMMNYLIDCRKNLYASPNKPVLPPWPGQ
jgi:hypothetical protein